MDVFRLRTSFPVACMLVVLASVGFALGQQPEKWVAPARATKKKNPVAADDKSIAAGKAVYAQQCLSCHGASGKGDGPAAKDLPVKAGDLAAPDVLADTDGALFWKITEGRAPMPAYDKLVGENDRWHVVNYLRALTLAEPRRALSSILKPYSGARGALAQDDLAGARAVIAALDDAVSKAAAVPTSGLDADATAAWKALQPKLADALGRLRTAEALDSYRSAFRDFSDVLRDGLARFGHAEAESLTVLRCAKDEATREARWIQPGGPPLNPYLGSKDPGCGEVEARIEPVAGAHKKEGK